jgi:Kef-type K+ transport system membrane component KefB
MRMRAMLFPEAFHGVSDILLSAETATAAHSSFFSFQIPFQELGNKLADSLDLGSLSSMNGSGGDVSEEATTMVMGSIGRDLLVFLSASVLVTTVASTLKVTPILGYLVMGAILGPHGLDMFANTKADLELGDFGILFLLFSEGLEVSSTRLQKLANYLPLGLAQLSLTTGVLTAAILMGGPEFLERFLPLDAGLINIHNPVEAVILALAGTLSTSAFIFPVLKECGWEEEESGQAATSILLLQDLAVAPLLVLLPFLVGQDATDYTAIGFLTAKATFGFGSVVAIGSFLLRGLFRLVAQTRSTETFVALCLLVSAGMGAIAKSFGLTDTAGAFAAGVLLANTNYRAQIQADVLPFKGILLGIFFMVAGSNFDVELVEQEWPTIITGAVALITLKAATIAAATRVPRWAEPNRLPTVDAIRIALLLSGGGEFAFVVLALAEKLDVLPKELGGLLTAIVLITMGVTPLLGDLAIAVSRPFSVEEEENQQLEQVEATQVARNSIVVCGHGEVGRALLRVLEDEATVLPSKLAASECPCVVAFDTDPTLLDSIFMAGTRTVVLYGDGTNPEVIRSSGIPNPLAIFVAYEDFGRELAATSRLRRAFADTPIYARASKRKEATALEAAGATEIVVEFDELARSAPDLLSGVWRGALDDSDYETPEDLRVAAAGKTGLSLRVVDSIFGLFEAVDQDVNGLLSPKELTSMVRRTREGFIASDEEIEVMEDWLATNIDSAYPIDKVEFCRLYINAPDFMKDAFGVLDKKVSKDEAIGQYEQ